MASTYADRINGLETSTAIKGPVAVATTAAITLSGLQTIAGVAVVAGDRVLVKDQVNATENGIWLVSASAWSRAIDFNGSRDAIKGTMVLNNADRLLYTVTSDSEEIGVDAFNFGQANGAQVNTMADLYALTSGQVAVGQWVLVRSTGWAYQRTADAAVDADVVPPDSVLKFYGRGAADIRKNANLGTAINFFDFLMDGYTDGDRASIALGTYMGDLAVPWVAFRDALAVEAAAGRRPHGVIPQCTIRTSVSPNFAMDFLRIDTHGLPAILKTGGGIGLNFDGRGLGRNGFGVRRMEIGPIEATSETGNIGYNVLWCHKSVFRRPQSRGGSFAAIYVCGCVTSYFDNPVAAAQVQNWVNVPSVALYVGSADGSASDGIPRTVPSSWCTFANPAMEYASDYGIFIDYALGTMLINGTSEGNGQLPSGGLGHGLVLGYRATYTKVHGGTYEGNVGDDVLLSSAKVNFFTDVDTETVFRMTGDARNNVVRGGKGSEVILEAGTKTNVVTEFWGDVTDLSVNPHRNRCYNNRGSALSLNWHNDNVPTTPAVSTTSGALVSATASMTHSLTADNSVRFTVIINIADNGTGAGFVTVELPLPARYRTIFQASVDTLGIAALADVSTASPTVLRVRNTDGTYAGGSGRQLTVSGVYDRA